jgi:hypothetical protein
LSLQCCHPLSSSASSSAPPSPPMSSCSQAGWWCCVMLCWLQIVFKGLVYRTKKDWGPNWTKLWSSLFLVVVAQIWEKSSCRLPHFENVWRLLKDWLQLVATGFPIVHKCVIYLLEVTYTMRKVLNMTRKNTCPLWHHEEQTIFWWTIVRKTTAPYDTLRCGIYLVKYCEKNICTSGHYEEGTIFWYFNGILRKKPTLYRQTISLGKTSLDRSF